MPASEVDLPQTSFLLRENVPVRANERATRERSRARAVDLRLQPIYQFMPFHYRTHDPVESMTASRSQYRISCFPLLTFSNAGPVEFCPVSLACPAQRAAARSDRHPLSANRRWKEQRTRCRIRAIILARRGASGFAFLLLARALARPSLIGECERSASS